jgi:hypothetical protein
MVTTVGRRALGIVGGAGLVFSFMASTARADDCSGPTDCSNVVHGSGLLAMLLALILAAAAAEAARRKAKEKKKFDDCRGAANWVKAGNEVGEAVANVAPQKKLQPTYAKRGGKVVASLDVRFTLDTMNSYTKIVEPWWPNMTEAEKAIVKNLAAAAQAHENGHIKVAEEVYKEASTTINGEGEREQDAFADLEARIQEHRDQTQEKVDAATEQYDAETNHGRNQAAVGGQNIDLQCP